MIDPHSSSAEDIETLLASASSPVSAATASAIREWVARRVLSDPQRAFEIASALRDAGERGDDPESRAHGWRCFGDASLYQGRFHEAREAYERASDFARTAGLLGLRGQVLVAQIGVLSNQGRAEAAADLASEAEALLNEAGDRPYLARLYMNLGNAAFHRHEYQQAHEHFVRADREFQALGSTDGMTLGLRINLGIAADLAFGRVEEAREIFLGVERDCARLELHHLEAQAKFNRAHLETLRGNYREAITLLETAEAMFAREDAPELMAATQLTRAEAFVDLGMPDEAIDLAGRAGTTYRSCELDLDAAVADEALARALRSEGRTTEARRILEEVRAFYTRAELPVGVARTDLEIVRTARGLAELADAEARAFGALTVLEERGLVESQTRARIALAEVLRRSGELARAESALRPVLAESSRLGARTRVDLWTVAGRVARDAGRRFAALRRYRRAVTEVEREWHLTAGAELKARAAGTDADREFIDLLVCGRRVGFDNLFRLVQATQERPVSAAESGEAGAQAWSRRRAELASLVRRVQRRELEAMQSGGRIDPVAMETLRAEIAQLEAEVLAGVRTAFFRPRVPAATETSDRPGTRDAGPSGRSATRAELQSRLGPGQAVLVYFHTGARILLLVLRADCAHFESLTLPPKGLEGLLRDWHTRLESFALLAHQGRPNLAFHRPASDHLLARLAEHLVVPVLPALEGVGELVVVPHGVLHRVPFECLRVGDDYLGDRFRIRRLPSLSLLERSLARAASTVAAAGPAQASATAATAAPAEAAATAPRPTARTSSAGRRDVVLVAVQNGPPGSEPEGRAVAARCGAELRIDPSSAEVLEALENARHVHWTTHGVLRADNPLFSHLATRDGGLFLADLRGRRLPVERLVLSACDTGTLVSGRSDDVAGVSLAFLEAGAGELVAGLWRLHDEATVEFMQRFYMELGDGESAAPTALALQRAARSMRESWDHPFYWAGIALYA